MNENLEPKAVFVIDLKCTVQLPVQIWGNFSNLHIVVSAVELCGVDIEQ